MNKSGYPAPKEVIRLMARKTASQQSRERLKVWLLTINEHESVVDKEISRLIRLQSALHRMYLQACNGPEWNETDKQYVKMLEDNIRGLVAGFRLAVEFNSDPRGNPVFIFEEGHVEGDRLPCNDMGGRGWAIW